MILRESPKQLGGRKTKPSLSSETDCRYQYCFSGILSPKGTICDLLLNSDVEFQFFAPTYMLEELDTHHAKLLKLSGLVTQELDFLIHSILKKITLIDLETLPPDDWQKAMELVKEVDEFDMPFIALGISLKAAVWTGDKRLIRGMTEKGIDWILDTRQVSSLRGT
jgi:predicted nucleic acid-binding protein